MACITPDCQPTVPAGSGQNVVIIPQRACSGAIFCDDKLAGLPFANQMDVVGVPEGERCLHRLAGPVGFVLHDPNRPGGANYVGAYPGAIRFIPGESLGAGECGYLAALRDVTPAGSSDTILELVPQVLTERSDGDIGLIIKCSGGKARQDIMVPESFDPDNPCETNLSFLAWVNQVVIVNGSNVLQKVWKQITRFVIPETQLPESAEPDFTSSSWRRVAWFKRGSCWELVRAPAVSAAPGCSTLTSVGETFDYFLACDVNEEKKVEPITGFVPVGLGGKWTLKKQGMTRITRTFIGQKNAGFTTTTNIPGVIDTTGVTSGQQSGTYDLNILTGFVSGCASIAWLRCSTIVNIATGSVAGECLAQVKANDDVIAESWIDSALFFGYKNDVYVPVALSGDTFTFELIAVTSDPVHTQAWSKIEIIGWE